MDDMKRLVERYKRELMEYSKAARPEPSQKLDFPEMTVENTPKQESIHTENTESADQNSVQKKPEIIGYADNNDLMSAFSEMFVSIDPKPEEEETALVGNSFEEETDSYEEYVDPIPDPAEEAEPETDGIPNEADNGVSTVTPQQAEELGDIPESGSSPDEQLGKRDFEDQTPVQNSRDDIRPLRQSGIAPTPVEEKNYSSLQEFTDANIRRGTVRFRTYTARGALPVPGAKIVVSKNIGGEKHVFYTLTTDISGQTPVISLPAPPKELSITPDSTITPYAVYNAEVTSSGYNDVLITNMPVFEGVLSIQRVALVPAIGQRTPDIITESEPDLNGGA